MFLMLFLIKLVLDFASVVKVNGRQKVFAFIIRCLSLTNVDILRQLSKKSKTFHHRHTGCSFKLRHAAQQTLG